MTIQDINRSVGNIDLYLLDQLLKGRFEPSMKILDAGCGEGRNLHYFIQQGYEVYGVDREATAIQMLRMMNKARQDCFIRSSVEDMPFVVPSFDAILCNAVLHFADGHAHFDSMFAALCGALKPGGLLFIRSCGKMGLCHEPLALGDGRYALEDGSERYLLDQEKIDLCLEKYGLALAEPIKAVNVNDQRSMLTLVLYKK